MMRVLHVVTSLGQGGMENGVCNLAIGLRAQNIETHIACLEHRGAFSERLPEQSLVTTLGKKNGFSLRAVWTLARTLRSVRPHVVHTHNLGPLIYASLATFGGKMYPILHGEHALLADWERKPNRIRQRRILYRSCRSIHTVSQAQVAELIPIAGSQDRIHAIANGVDTDQFQPGDRSIARKKLGLPLDATIVGLIGRFGAFKRHDVLLSAFEELAKDEASIHLLLIGSGGSEEQRIRALADASSFRSRIHFTGFMADPTVGYHALDLLAIPSINEGMSNAALEAMSCEVPVIANIDCGHEQIITHGKDGIITDITTSSLLKIAIESVLASPKVMVQLRLNARATIFERFTLTRMLSEYAALYARCVGRSN